jgi:hypothetical protein
MEIGLPLPRLACGLTAPDGEGMLFPIRYFVHHLPDCGAMFTEILRRAIPTRYRSAVSWLPA